jgi:sulfur-oxidizing protein SoxB
MAGWAPVAAPVEGKDVWDVFAHWLKDKKTVRVGKLDLPRLTRNMENNHGIAYPKEYGL